ncbi:MAG: anti-sigma factor antagonist [Treponema sp.]|jgi:anti-sigma B factor antagonist|nr:anti-sigma factor antagonist [Treponema sp.]
MFIDTEKLLTKVILSPEGRLDTLSAPGLERKVWRLDRDIKVVVLDFARVTYISSSGLRVLLQIQKLMKERQGKMFIKNINQSLESIFEMTGLVGLLTQEEKMVLIRKEATKTKLTLALAGKIDDETAPLLEKELYQVENEFTTIYLDCSQLSSISGSGFEVLLAIQKSMTNKNRSLVLQHISEPVQAMIEDAGLTGMFIQEEKIILKKNVGETEYLLSFVGSLDKKTIAVLQEEIKQLGSNVTKVILDFSHLTYMSKEGFRVFLWLQADLQQKNLSLEIRL